MVDLFCKWIDDGSINCQNNHQGELTTEVINKAGGLVHVQLKTINSLEFVASLQNVP